MKNLKLLITPLFFLLFGLSTISAQSCNVIPFSQEDMIGCPKLISDNSYSIVTREGNVYFEKEYSFEHNLLNQKVSTFPFILDSYQPILQNGNYYLEEGGIKVPQTIVNLYTRIDNTLGPVVKLHNGNFMIVGSLLGDYNRRFYLYLIDSNGQVVQYKLVYENDPDYTIQSISPTKEGGAFLYFFQDDNLYPTYPIVQLNADFEKTDFFEDYYRNRFLEGKQSNTIQACNENIIYTGGKGLDYAGPYDYYRSFDLSFNEPKLLSSIEVYTEGPGATVLYFFVNTKKYLISGNTNSIIGEDYSSRELPEGLDDYIYLWLNDDFSVTRLYQEGDSYCISTEGIRPQIYFNEQIQEEQVVSCNAPTPTVPNLTANSTCEPVSIDYSERYEDAQCPYVPNTILRKWVARDNCGEEITLQQRIEFVDNARPDIDWSKNYVIVDLLAGEEISDPSDIKATDNCDPNVQMSFSETSSKWDDCTYILNRTWVATDACGNSDSDSQIIEIRECGSELAEECEVFLTNPIGESCLLIDDQQFRIVSKDSNGSRRQETFDSFGNSLGTSAFVNNSTYKYRQATLSGNIIQFMNEEGPDGTVSLDPELVEYFASPLRTVLSIFRNIDGSFWLLGENDSRPLDINEWTDPNVQQHHSLNNYLLNENGDLIKKEYLTYYEYTLADYNSGKKGYEFLGYYASANSTLHIYLHAKSNAIDRYVAKPNINVFYEFWPKYESFKIEPYDCLGDGYIKIEGDLDSETSTDYIFNYNTEKQSLVYSIDQNAGARISQGWRSIDEDYGISYNYFFKTIDNPNNPNNNDPGYGHLDFDFNGQDVYVRGIFTPPNGIVVTPNKTVNRIIKDENGYKLVSQNCSDLADPEPIAKLDIKPVDLCCFEGELALGSTIEYYIDFENLGDDDVTDQHIFSVYLSPDQTLDLQTDIAIDELVANYGAAGEYHSIDGELILPIDTEAGAYYVIVQADSHTNLNETNESNNVWVSSFSFDLVEELTETDCPDQINGFNFLGNFNSQSFFISNDKMTWLEASDLTDNYNEALLPALTEEELDFVLPNLNEIVFVGNEKFAHLKFWDGSIGIDGPWTKRKFILAVNCDSDENGCTCLEDQEAPVLSGIPSDLILNITLGETIPNPTGVTASDDCDDDVSISFHEFIDQLTECTFNISRQWIASDDCGNSSSAFQKIFVQECDGQAKADLRIPSVCCMDSEIRIGDVVSYKFDLLNAGTAIAAGDYTIKVFLSPDQVYDNGNEIEVGVINTGNTPIGTISDVYGEITVEEEVAIGENFLIMVADFDHQIAELAEENNVYISFWSVNVKEADHELECPTQVEGFSHLGAINNRAFFLSDAKMTWEDADVLANSFTGIPTLIDDNALALILPQIDEIVFVGNQEFAHMNFWDGSLGIDGPWTKRRFIMELYCDEIDDCACPLNYDPVCSTDGITYANECLAACDLVTEFSYGPCSSDDLPDLEITNLCCFNSEMQIGHVESYEFDLTNSGMSIAEGNYTIGVYLSADQISGNGNDVQVGIVNTGNTPIGTIANVYGEITLEENVSLGNNFLILKVDRDNQIIESNEGNNYWISNEPILVKDINDNEDCKIAIEDVDPNACLLMNGDEFSLISEDGNGNKFEQVFDALGNDLGTAPFLSSLENLEASIEGDQVIYLDENGNTQSFILNDYFQNTYQMFGSRIKGITKNADGTFWLIGYLTFPPADPNMGNEAFATGYDEIHAHLLDANGNNIKNQLITTIEYIAIEYYSESFPHYELKNVIPTVDGGFVLHNSKYSYYSSRRNHWLINVDADFGITSENLNADNVGIENESCYGSGFVRFNFQRFPTYRGVYSSGHWITNYNVDPPIRIYEYTYTPYGGLGGFSEYSFSKWTLPNNETIGLSSVVDNNADEPTNNLFYSDPFGNIITNEKVDFNGALGFVLNEDQSLSQIKNINGVLSLEQVNCNTSECPEVYAAHTFLGEVNGSNYFLSEQATTWDEAQALAQNAEAKLPILGEQELNHILNQLTEIVFVGNQPFAHLKFWDGSIGIDGPWTKRRYILEFDCDAGVSQEEVQSLIDTKQIDLSSFALENIADQKQEVNLSIYPNPTNGNVNLSFDSPIAGNFNFQVFNALGKKVLETKSAISFGGNVLMLPTEKLVPGIYYVKGPKEIKPGKPLRFIRL